MALRLLRTSMLCAALVLSKPVSAQEDGADRWRTMSGDELSRNLNEFLRDPNLEPCSRGVPATEEVVRRDANRPNIGVMLPLARMFCAMERNQKSEALTQYLAFEAFDLPFDPFMGLQIAGYAENRDEQLRQLRILLLESQEPFESSSSQAVVNWTLRALNDAGREDDVSQLALQAVRAGRLRTLGDDYASAIAFRALASAASDAPDMVPDLLRSITEPITFLSLLADRRYVEIWPLVEARAGRHLQTVMDELIASELSKLAADPASAEALKTSAYALRYVHRYDEVIALVERWRSRPDAPQEIDEDLAWAINMQAYALHSLGRKAEADLAMTEIANLDEERFGWVVNFAINRSSLVVEDGRYEEGLLAVDRARAVSDKQGSTYARLAVARDRACALERLGRHDEAMLEQPYLVENIEAGLDVAGTGLLCLGQRDELVGLLSQALADEDLARQNYALLQRREADLFYLDSVLPSVPEVVQSEPVLRDLLERYVRVIPDEFVPNI